MAQHGVYDVQESVEGLPRETEVYLGEVDVLREGRSLGGEDWHGLEDQGKAIRGHGGGGLRASEGSEEAAEHVIPGHVGESGGADEGFGSHAGGSRQDLEGCVGGGEHRVVAALGWEVCEARGPQPDPEVGELGGQRAHARLQGLLCQAAHVEELPSEHERAAGAPEAPSGVAAGDGFSSPRWPLAVGREDKAGGRRANEDRGDRVGAQVGPQGLALMEAHAGRRPAFGEC